MAPPPSCLCGRASWIVFAPCRERRNLTDWLIALRLWNRTQVCQHLPHQPATLAPNASSHRGVRPLPGSRTPPRECLLGRLGLSHPVGLGPSSWAQTELLASHLLFGKVGSGLRGHPSPARPDPGSPDPRFGVKHLPRRLQRNRLISLVLIFFLKWPEAQKTPCFSHGKHFPASLSVHSLTQPKPID